jgi:Family of unknown function (DUF6176)
MLRVAIRRVKPEHLDELRQWLQTANGPRRSEALATLIDEGVRHELAYLLTDDRDPLLVYVMEVEDVERAKAAFERSTHPIDADHRRVMTLALDRDADAELVLDLRAER